MQCRLTWLPPRHGLVHSSTRQTPHLDVTGLRRALWEVSGLEAARVDGLTGVWLGPNKVRPRSVPCKSWSESFPELTPASCLHQCFEISVSVTAQPH